MNRFFFVFVCGMLSALITQAVQNASTTTFETMESLTWDEMDEQEIGQFMGGQIWLENRMSSEIVDLNRIYQEKAFTRKLTNNSSVKRYQKSYTTWIEERICHESPFIDKPVRARMTSRYGRRVHPVSGRSHVHAGIDFRGKRGTPVLAASNGIIKVARRKGAYGKTIIIDHGNSYTTLYGHLSGYKVKEGEWVNLGQTIGYIGRTGRATGPHLHFEVRCHNVPLNPVKYLGKLGQVAEVRFKRRMKSYTRGLASHPQMSRAPKRQRRTAAIKRDPNYYTRMINLQKLKKLKQKRQ